MAVRRGLNKGRGLGSLIPPREEPEISTAPEKPAREETVPAQKKETKRVPAAKKPASSPDSRKKTGSGTDEEQIVTVRLTQIVPNESQPRKNFDEDSLEKLADSIRQFGVLQPLLVKKKGRYYEILAGERRWRAARMAGLKEIPVVIRTYGVQDAAAISLIENIQREDLNPIEEAQAYRRLIEEFGLTQEEAASRVSRSRTALTNSLRLLRLTESVQQKVISGELSMGHARALLSLEDAAVQNEAAEMIIRKGLSVRETEKLVKKLLEPEKPRERSQSGKDTQLDAAMRTLEEGMKQRLGTKVTIRQSGREKGRIEIEYYSMDDLERLTELIRGEESL